MSRVAASEELRQREHEGIREVQSRLAALARRLEQSEERPAHLLETVANELEALAEVLRDLPEQ